MNCHTQRAHRYVITFCAMLLAACTTAQSAEPTVAPPVKAVAPTAPTVKIDTDWRRPWYNDHAARLTEDGKLPIEAVMFDKTGQLKPAGGRRVVLMRDGKPYVPKSAASAAKLTPPTSAGARSAPPVNRNLFRTNDLGRLEIEVEPGVYSIAIGQFGDQDGLAFTSVRVLPYEKEPQSPVLRNVADGQPDKPVSKPPTGVSIALLQPADVALLQLLINKRMRTTQTVRNTQEAKGAQQADWYKAPTRSMQNILAAAADSKRTVITTEAVERFAEAYADRWDAIPYDSPWHFNHEILLENNRSLKGNLRTFGNDGSVTPVAEADIWFVRNGKVLKKISSDFLGNYTAELLEPGIYSVIAVNKGSFGGYGVRFTAPVVATPPPRPPFKRSPLLKPVSWAGLKQEGSLNTNVGTPANSQGFLNGFGGGGGGAGGGAAAAAAGGAAGGAGAGGMEALLGPLLGGLGYGLMQQDASPQ